MDVYWSSCDSSMDCVSGGVNWAAGQIHSKYIAIGQLDKYIKLKLLKKRSFTGGCSTIPSKYFLKAERKS